MIPINKHDVESIFDSVNRNLPQRSKTLKMEFKIDYAAQYGGWMIVYYDDSAKVRYPLGNFRVTHKEAYRFFEGILFSLKSL